MPLTNELQETIKNIVAMHCGKGDDGFYYSEIHADYRDQLDDKALLGI